MGEAEWLPSSSERDTEITEVERAKREQDGKSRRVSETAEVPRPLEILRQHASQEA